MLKPKAMYMFFLGLTSNRWNKLWYEFVRNLVKNLLSNFSLGTTYLNAKKNTNKHDCVFAVSC